VIPPMFVFQIVYVKQMVSFFLHACYLRATARPTAACQDEDAEGSMQLLPDSDSEGAELDAEEEEEGEAYDGR
jgi:hypothetical protein